MSIYSKIQDQSRYKLPEACYCPIISYEKSRHREERTLKHIHLIYLHQRMSTK